MSMQSYYKEATVGALVLVGVLVFLGGGLWLSGRSWNTAGLVPVYYENIGNLKQGAPVRISGAPVGRVEEIRFVDVGRVLVLLEIDRKKVRPTAAATAQIVSVGMLGDAMIDFLPGAGQDIGTQDTLRGTLGGGDLMAVGEQLATRVGGAITALERMLDTSLVVEMRQTFQSASRLMDYLGDQRTGPGAELVRSLAVIQQVGARLDTTLTGVDLGTMQRQMTGTMQRADSAMVSVAALAEELKKTSALAGTMLADMQSGKGTLGKLANDPALYNDLQAMLQSVTKLVDELAKNPGKLGITVKIP